MKRGFPVAATLLAFGLSSGVALGQTADLAIISNTASARHARVGDDVTFTITARNNGPDAADFVVELVGASGGVVVQWPSDDGPCYRAAFASFNGANGFFSADGGACEYGVVYPGEEVAAYWLEQRVSADSAKRQTLSACVTTTGPPLNDPDPTNDCSTATVKIVGRRS